VTTFSHSIVWHSPEGMVLKMDCFERFSIDLRPLILWLTSSFAESYDNVATYEFKKVTRVRIPISSPRSLDCREFSPSIALTRAKHARLISSVSR
jgi:hypothetical protein